jgi:predicted amidohydrolase
MRFWIGLVLCGAAFAGDLSLNVAGLRIMPERWNKTANLAKFEQYARSAAAQGAQLALAPEGFLEGYIANIKANPDLTREKYLTIAESMDGPSLKRVRSLAAS